MERVGIYNRCSTEEESQKNALVAQAQESREMAEKLGWRIAAQYIEAETGTIASRRSGYQELLADMEEDKFDIVMIKSIDRLTRSAKDWYFFLSRLTANRLRLYIYIERKFYTPDDNLISGIKAILAEDFSRELSKKIKNAHRRRQEKKSGCNITCEMFGWNKVARDVYELNEEEAAYYRAAFDLAGEGKGFYTISNILYEMGARGRNGQKISEVQWRKMLYTPRAHGAVVLNKRTYNFDAKRYEAVPEKDWIVMENALPPIVSEKYQQEIIGLLQKRAEKYRQKIRRPAEKGGKGIERGCYGKYALSGKLLCASCGGVYYHTGSVKGEKNAGWKCATFLRSGRTRQGENPAGCDNRNLKEGEVFDALTEIFRERRPAWYGEEAALRGDFLRLVAKILDVPGEEGEAKGLERECKRLKKRQETLMEKLLKGVISDEDFKKYHGEAARRQKEAEDKIECIKSRKSQYNNYETRLQRIKEEIEREKLTERAITEEILKGVERVTVHKDGVLEVSFS